MENPLVTPWVFFGTSRFSVILLEELKKRGIVPELIVTAPDRPVGRAQTITPPPAKDWAIENDIATFQPEKLKDDAFIEELSKYQLFIVASYGKIIPKVILDIPVLGTLNIHPSLLPKYRGASPIQSQITNGESVIGTSIMLMDEEMDHGPIIVQKKSEAALAPYAEVEKMLAIESAALLAEALPFWIKKERAPVAQDHGAATYTKILRKEDGEISLSGNPRENYLKYLAYREWPKVFFFFEKDGRKQRAIITNAMFQDGAFAIKKVVPEGKSEMAYEDFVRSHPQVAN